MDSQKGNGINIRNGNSGVMDHVTMNANGANGVLISSQQTRVDNTNAWRLYSSIALSNMLDGFRFDDASSTSGFGLNSEGNGRYGFYANRPYIYLQGYTEANTANNVYLDTGCFDCFTVVRDVDNTSYQGNSGSFMYNMAGQGNTPELNPNTGRFGVRGAFSTPVVTPTYDATITINNDLGNDFIITATNGSNFTVSAPRNQKYSQRITITIKNTSSGSLGTVTWNGAYLMSSWTNPANGFSRSIDFQLNVATGKWTEVSRTPSDVPN